MNTAMKKNPYLPVFLLFVISCSSVTEHNDWIENKMWDLSDAYSISTETRDKICLHGIWRFSPAFSGRGELPGESGQYYSKVPGRWLSSELYNTYIRSGGILKPVERINGRKLNEIRDGWYTRYVSIPERFRGRKIYLTVGYIGASEADFYADGKLLEEYRYRSKNDYGLMNKLRIDLSAWNKSESVRIDVFLHFEKYFADSDIQSLSLDNIFLEAFDSDINLKDILVTASVRKKMINLDLDINNPHGLRKKGLLLKTEITEKQSGRVVIEQSMKLPDFSGDDVENFAFALNWDDPVCWDIEKPNLYSVKTGIYEKDRLVDESFPQDFGFREFYAEGGDFILNGEKMHIFAMTSGDVFDRYSWYYARNEVIGDTFSNLKAAGYNTILLHITWPYRWGDAASYQGISPAYINALFDEADRQGFYIILDTPYLWNKNDLDAYRKELRVHFRYWGNHPSLIMNMGTFNKAGYPWAQHPDMADNLDYRWPDDWGGREFAELTETEVRRADPSREVYHNYSGNLNNIYTTMHYMSFGLPLQEREDWPAKWSRTKKTAFFASEFGLPLRWQFSDFDGPDGGPGVYLIYEHAARYFGDDVYLLAPGPVRYSSPGWITRVDTDLVLGRELDPAYSLVKKLFISSQLRAWRGYDVSGVGIFAEEGDIFDADFTYHVITDFASGSIKEPGLKPDKIAVPVRLPYLDKPNELALAMAEALSPFTAWIGGEQGNFNSKDHAYFANEIMEKQIIIINDTRENVEGLYSVNLNSSDGKISESREGSFSARIGEQLRIPFSFTLPAVLDRQDYLISLVIDGPGKKYTDSFEIQVFPEQGLVKTGQTSGLIDKSGKTTAMLDDLGLKYIKISSPEQLTNVRHLIIGCEALNEGAADILSEAERLGYLKDDLKVLIFEQNDTSLLGLESEQLSERYAFIHDGSHPVVKGLCDADLANWRGSSELIEAFSPPQEGTESSYHYPMFKFKCGNSGIVSTFSIRKPAFGNIHTILGNGFDLSYSPLCEIKKGESLVILCQLDVTDRYNSDPVAETIVHNLFSYFFSEAGGSPDGRKYVIAADDGYRELLEKEFMADPASFKNSFDSAISAETKTIVIGGQIGLKDPEIKKLDDFVRNGGTVLFLTGGGREFDYDLPFPVDISAERVFRAEPRDSSFLLNGLGRGGFYFRNEKILTGFQAEDAEEILSPGLIVRKRRGSGYYFFCGINPEDFEYRPSGKADYDSFINDYTVMKAQRILNCLLISQGIVPVKIPLFSFDSGKGFYPEGFSTYDVNAFHNW